MELLPIQNIENFKFKVKTTISTLRAKEPSFHALYPQLISNDQLFVVGGFLRNIANENYTFRDIDLISSMKKEELLNCLKNIDTNIKVNRLGGIKLSLKSFDVDIWSIHDNWAFGEERIKFDFNSDLDDKIVIEKIAEGSFFNYDSLVMNLNTNRFSVKHYNDLLKSKKLDILRKNKSYVYRNPTREGNIIRAYFLQKKYNFSLSDNVKAYFIEELKIIGALKDSKGLDLVLIKSLDYEKKYQASINRNDFEEFLNSIIKSHGPLFNEKD
ncbi:hypothetical protein ACFOUP_09625 [Belliella kenyensis]|uniref:Poly A polymerase head domain-containing protein n=1 Tax=Belliella kenyensis TaxID=1472724 RepID=A0ABV8EK28_9BACT|nr:hypothetical protein [Belliella kenyensis]MCH7402968.1 hypothetical protein [Belliella kenyensis]MDN3605004.1 hypothetical protein [Belliella kenyensis]